MKQKKTIIITIVILLAAVIAVLAIANRNNSDDRPGLISNSAGNEIHIAWEDIDIKEFEGDLVNGKGEVSHSVYEGAELLSILKDNGIELSDDAVVTAIAEDNYAAELNGAELIEDGKVYVAMRQDGEMIEDIEGGQGAQLIVFGDSNSKRAVRYLKTISIEQ